MEASKDRPEGSVADAAAKTSSAPQVNVIPPTSPPASSPQAIERTPLSNSRRLGHRRAASTSATQETKPLRTDAEAVIASAGSIALSPTPNRKLSPARNSTERPSHVSSTATHSRSGSTGGSSRLDPPQQNVWQRSWDSLLDTLIKFHPGSSSAAPTVHSKSTLCQSSPSLSHKKEVDIESLAARERISRVVHSPRIRTSPDPGTPLFDYFFVVGIRELPPDALLQIHSSASSAANSTNPSQPHSASDASSSSRPSGPSLPSIEHPSRAKLNFQKLFHRTKPNRDHELSHHPSLSYAGTTATSSRSVATRASTEHPPISAPAEILFQYPPNKTVELQGIPQFCFPSGAVLTLRRLMRTPSRSEILRLRFNQNTTQPPDKRFVFMLADSKQQPIYGVCIQREELIDDRPSFIDPLTPSPPSSVKFRYAAPRAYCLLSRYPFIHFFFDVLDTVLDIEHIIAVSHGSAAVEEVFSLPADQSDGAATAAADGPKTPAEKPHGSTNPVSTMETQPQPHPVHDLLARLLAAAVPAPGHELQLCLGIASVTKELRYFRAVSYAEEESSELSQYGLVIALRVVPLAKLLTLLTAVLLERQIIIVSANVRLLSAVALTTVIPLIRPFVCQALFIPVLPEGMEGFLDAPVPYVIGTTALSPQFLSSVLHPIGRRPRQIVLLDIDRGELHVPEKVVLPPLPRLDILHARIDTPYSEFCKAFEHENHNEPVDAEATAVVRNKHHAIRVPYRPTFIQSALASKIAGDLYSHFNDIVFPRTRIRRHCVRDITQTSTPVTVFLRESWLAECTPQELPFMEQFCDTNTFQAFVDLQLRQEDLDAAEWLCKVREEHRRREEERRKQEASRTEVLGK